MVIGPLRIGTSHPFVADWHHFVGKDIPVRFENGVDQGHVQVFTHVFSGAFDALEGQPLIIGLVDGITPVVLIDGIYVHYVEQIEFL